MADDLQKRRGKWLENFLNPAAQVDDGVEGSKKAPGGGRQGKRMPGFRSLARESLEILGITEKYDLDNDPGLNALDMINNDPDVVRDFCKLYDPECLQRPVSNDVSWELLARFMLADRRQDQLGAISSIPSFKFSDKKESWGLDIKRFFTFIFPVWTTQFSLLGAFKKEAGNGNPLAGEFSNFLVPYYKLIKDFPVWDDETKTVKTYRKFFLPAGPIPKKTWRAGVFPWPIVGATIGFDFLKHGGQYMGKKGFLFCEHCGRFSFIERQSKPPNEKRFCSASCRTKARQAQLKA